MMKQQIAVVDYGMGNLRSVSKALEHVAPDSRVKVTDDPNDIANADHVVFPGQGAARDCMAAIKRHQLNAVVLEAAREKPFLGICMGLQVLLGFSDENNGVELLNLFPGKVTRLPPAMQGEEGLPLKIPHMGWSQARQTQSHPLWHHVDDDSRFYFVHSYYVEPDDEALAAATTEYGVNFVSAIAGSHVFACQFHPEKSADSGLQLLRNFVQWDGR